MLDSTELTDFISYAMSLATDQLTDYLTRKELTQAEFALSTGMTPTNISDILNGNVEISGRNLGKLLRGIAEAPDRDAFLSAHLRDQIPNEQADRVKVHLVQEQATNGHLAEDRTGNESTQLEAEVVAAFADLPSNTYRKRVINFMRQLRRDADLRDLFNRVMGYLE